MSDQGTVIPPVDYLPGPHMYFSLRFPCRRKKEGESCSVVPNSLWPHGLYSPWNPSCQDTGVGSLSLLQGIFPTQGSNPGLPHCRQILYQLSHQGRPGILEWVTYPFSSETCWPRNWTGVSCIAGRFFTSWTTREIPLCQEAKLKVVANLMSFI